MNWRVYVDAEFGGAVTVLADAAIKQSRTLQQATHGDEFISQSDRVKLEGSIKDALEFFMVNTTSDLRSNGGPRDT